MYYYKYYNSVLVDGNRDEVGVQGPRDFPGWCITAGRRLGTFSEQFRVWDINQAPRVFDGKNTRGWDDPQLLDTLDMAKQMLDRIKLLLNARQWNKDYHKKTNSNLGRYLKKKNHF